MYLGIQLGSAFAYQAQAGAYTSPSLVPDRERPEQLCTVCHVASIPEGVLVGGSVETLVCHSPQIPHAQFDWNRLGSLDLIMVDRDGHPWTTADLLVVLLRKLVMDVKATITERVEATVFSVPNAFLAKAQQIIPEALNFADWPTSEVFLIDDMRAAAVAHGLPAKTEDPCHLVIDLGATGLRCGLIDERSWVHGHAEVGVNGGSSGHGLARSLIDLAIDTVRINGWQELSTLDQALLRRTVRQWMDQFANSRVQQISASLRLSNSVNELTITRKQFGRLLHTVLREVHSASEQLLASREIQWSDLKALILVGGGMVWSEVRTSLREFSGLPDNRILCQFPGRAISYGAAMAARGLHGDMAKILWRIERPIARPAIGFVVADPVTRAPKMDLLIPGDRPLPASKERRYVLNRQDQARLVLKAVAQYSREGKLLPLGEVKIEADPEVPDGPYFVTVQQEVANQLLIDVKCPSAERQIRHQFAVPQREGVDAKLFHTRAATTSIVV